MSLEGQLRFYDEKILDDKLDFIGLRVNGEDFWDFSDIDEVDFEELFRLYRIWIPYDFKKSSKKDLKIEAISSDPDSVLLFKPAMREITVSRVELHKNIGLNFRVIDGMFVQGQTYPAVPDA